jgi:hypothetical protein
LNLKCDILVFKYFAFSNSNLYRYTEVALQLSGDPPTLVVPIRMGGVPPRASLRRVGAA